MRKRREKIVQSRAGWRKADQVRKIKIVMTVIAIALCISIAAGSILAWVQIKKPFTEHNVSSAAVSSESTASGEKLPVYDNSYNLLVVNASNKLKPDYSVHLESFEGVTVDSKIIPALKKMLSDARDSGCNLKLTGGYVDAAQQDKLFNAAVQNLMKNQGVTQVRAENQVQNTIGRGGYNENQTGMAVEFAAEGSPENADFTTTQEYKWLIKNSVHYGFTLRYPEGKTSLTGMSFNPCHFRYVGSENAIKMREYSMCLEEYAAYKRQQSPK